MLSFPRIRLFARRLQNNSGRNCKRDENGPVLRFEKKHPTRRWTSGNGSYGKFAAVFLSLIGASGPSGSKAVSQSSPLARTSASSGLFKQGWIQDRSGHRQTGRVAAFTLVECMVALGILGLCFTVCMSAVVTNQVCDRKAKEQALAMDFLTKYVENIKALPFTSVAPGLPINSIYNGLGGAPLIAIPASNSWVSINTTAFLTFYPDLLWVSNRNPSILVTLAQNSIAGTLHDIEINVKMDWDAPISKGGRQEVEVDFLRTVDVPTL
jgi:prepilin-type N-terminal cleavage/methylation domain-containing protein